MKVVLRLLQILFHMRIISPLSCFHFAFVHVAHSGMNVCSLLTWHEAYDVDRVRSIRGRKSECHVGHAAMTGILEKIIGNDVMIGIVAKMTEIAVTAVIVAKNYRDC